MSRRLLIVLRARMSPALLVPILLASILLFYLAPDQAAFAASQETSEPVEYTFGQQATFRTRLQSDAPVTQASIFIQPADSAHTLVNPATVKDLGDSTYELSYVYDLNQPPLRAFSRVNYWFQVTTQGNTPYTTPQADFYYEDNRYQWQSLEAAPFRLHWYQGDLAFAQSVLDIARQGLEHIKTFIDLPASEMIDIYVYDTAGEMQATLNTAGKNWVAGHADPDLGVMVVALPKGPDQQLLMEQRIPHELMHILLYQSAGQGYLNLPTWVSEGLASVAELYPNPDYQILLENARQKGTLLPMVTLCQPFPRDASNALLAYAESTSFTRYLYQRFGQPGLQALVNSYANGAECERGVEGALGVSLKQLERQWRQESLNENTNLVALNNLLPWLVVLAAMALGPLAAMTIRRRRPGGQLIR